MLNADFPQSLGCSVVGELETNGALKLFILGLKWEVRKGEERDVRRKKWQVCMCVLLVNG